MARAGSRLKCSRRLRAEPAIEAVANDVEASSIVERRDTEEQREGDIAVAVIRDRTWERKAE